MEKLYSTIQLDDGDQTSGTILVDGETHTLGNALRTTIIQNPHCDVCAYSVPHPAENKFSLRLQAIDETNIVDLAQDGIQNFRQWVSNTEDEFVTKFNAFRPGSL